MQLGTELCILGPWLLLPRDVGWVLSVYWAARDDGGFAIGLGRGRARCEDENVAHTFAFILS